MIIRKFVSNARSKIPFPIKSFLNRHEKLDPTHYVFLILHYYERCRYGISYEDEWNLDRHIMRVLLHTLPKFKNGGKYGEHIQKELYPVDWDLLHTNKVLFDQKTKESMQAWDDMIDDIVNVLQKVVNNDLDFCYSLYGQDEVDRVMKVFAKNFQGFWW